MTHPPLILSPEVQDALASGRPVVALESTVITHGLPRPQNLELARSMEATVRAHGAVPATVAVLDGEIRVGLNSGELERLAGDQGAVKISRRDFGPAVVRRSTGGTTVAGTMIAAHWAGIRVFATGGIGGVHRGDRTDVSADLPELARTPVAVVCAGAKSILDLPATLEWLETHGVPVIGYGTTDFPAFFTRNSGLPVSASARDAAEAARMIQTHWQLGLGSGALLAVPCPEAAAMPPEAGRRAVEAALRDAERHNVRGKEVTPFLLARVAALTGGESMKANLALLTHNAQVAAELATALRELSAADGTADFERI